MALSVSVSLSDRIFGSKCRSEQTTGRNVSNSAVERFKN